MFSEGLPEFLCRTEKSRKINYSKVEFYLLFIVSMSKMCCRPIKALTNVFQESTYRHNFGTRTKTEI